MNHHHLSRAPRSDRGDLMSEAYGHRTPGSGEPSVCPRVTQSRASDLPSRRQNSEGIGTEVSHDVLCISLLASHQLTLKDAVHNHVACRLPELRHFAPP